MKFATYALFASALLFAGCSSSNDDNAAPSGGGGNGGGGGTTQLTPTTPCSVQMTVNGTAVSITADGLTNQCIQGSSGVPSERSYSGAIGDGVSSVTFGVDFGKFATGLSLGLPADTSFFNFFHTGAWPYGDVDASYNVVAVSTEEVIAGNYITYSTKYGSQAGSAFQVTELLPVTVPLSEGFVVVRVTFNCKLYSSNGTLVKTITNGTAVVNLSNI